VNATLAQGNSSCMFVTLLLAVLDVSARRLTYVRAGHIPPFLCERPAGGGEPVRLAGASALPLGLDENVRYAETSVALSGDDSLLVVTDGFTEAQDAAGRLYGEERVARFLAQWEAGGEEPLRHLVCDVQRFENGQPQSDDRAAVLLRLGAACGGIAPFEDDLLPHPEAISALTDRLSQWLETSGVDARATHRVMLTVEELLMNVGTHGGGATLPATVRLSISPQRVRGEILDAGLPCDPRLAPAPDLTPDAERRTIGGLGLRLVRELTAELAYERHDGRNCTTFAVDRATLG
jgi:sigma-B regulation protein RsbU (phosphoserine phosphatase)